MRVQNTRNRAPDWQIDLAITFLRDDERRFVTEKIASVKDFFSARAAAIKPLMAEIAIRERQNIKNRSDPEFRLHFLPGFSTI